MALHCACDDPCTATDRAGARRAAIAAVRAFPRAVLLAAGALLLAACSPGSDGTERQLDGGERDRDSADGAFGLARRRRAGEYARRTVRTMRERLAKAAEEVAASEAGVAAPAGGAAQPDAPGRGGARARRGGDRGRPSGRRRARARRGRDGGVELYRPCLPQPAAAAMSKLLEISLGIVTSVGGFLEVGSMATAAQAGPPSASSSSGRSLSARSASLSSSRWPAASRRSASTRSPTRSASASASTSSCGRSSQPVRQFPGARAEIGGACDRARVRDRHRLSMVGAAGRARRLAASLEGHLRPHREGRLDAGSRDALLRRRAP